MKSVGIQETIGKAGKYQTCESINASTEKELLWQADGDLQKQKSSEFSFVVLPNEVKMKH